MTTRLSPSVLAQLPPDVQRYSYDRAALRPRIVHLGLGAFFRAHGALYTEDCLELRGGDWGIVGASLQRPDQYSKLQPQDFLYSATEAGPGGRRARAVGCLIGLLVAPDDPAALIARMAHADTAIVSLTVTEKGYCHDPASGKLNFAHPAIVADLASSASPQSAIGLLAAALDARRRARLPAFTIACCDNLPGNGRLLSGLVREFAQALDPDLALWIEDHARFPCSMVDRIVPAATADDEAWFAGLGGVQDAAPVVHEPFRQWVMEDDFPAGGRPRWEEAGAQLTRDVAPYEHTKLRMLNGSHSAIAYLGYLAGHELVSDVAADAVFASYLQKLWGEIMPTLREPEGLPLTTYAETLLARFRNTGIRHRTWQIAMDGSQKLPQRLLGTVRDRLRQGLPVNCLAHAIAGWMRYVEGTDERGHSIEVRDPLLPVLRARLAGGRSAPEALIEVEQVFGADLAAHAGFRAEVTQAYGSLLHRGVRKAIALI